MYLLLPLNPCYKWDKQFSVSMWTLPPKITHNDDPPALESHLAAKECVWYHCNVSWMTAKGANEPLKICWCYLFHNLDDVLCYEGLRASRQVVCSIAMAIGYCGFHSNRPVPWWMRTVVDSRSSLSYQVYSNSEILCLQNHKQNALWGSDTLLDDFFIVFILCFSP